MFKINAEAREIRAMGIVGDPIDGFTNRQFIDALDQLGSGPLSIHLDTEGGDIFQGISIGNTIQTHQGRVTLTVDAISGSIGTVLMLPAEEIWVHESSMVVVHNPLTFAGGEADDFRQIANVLDLMADNIARQYGKRTNRSAEWWRATMQTETWFTAEEAIGVGLADAMVTDGATRTVTREGVKLAASLSASAIIPNAAATVAELQMRHRLDIVDGRRSKLKRPDGTAGSC